MIYNLKVKIELNSIKSTIQNLKSKANEVSLNNFKFATGRSYSG